MDDVWGQVAIEASQLYLTDGTKRSPFADTVYRSFCDQFLFAYSGSKLIIPNI